MELDERSKPLDADIDKATWPAPADVDSATRRRSLRPASPFRVVVASEAARLARDRLHLLHRHGFEIVERYDLITGADERALAEALAGAWGFVAGGQAVTAPLLERLPDLRVVARTGTGYDRIDVRAATERGVTIVVAAAENTESVADLTLALMLATLRNLVLLDRLARSGRWRDGITAALGLSDASVGIVGLGNIGRAVATRLHGFNCRILACEPEPDESFCRHLGIEVLSLRAMLTQVDVLTLHVPLTAATKQMIGASELALLPEHSVVINTSRGGVVDEAALVEALERGRLAGAGMDVFEHEPLPAQHPLTRLENVVLTPHVASYSRASVDRVIDHVTMSLIDAAQNRQPAGSVNGFPSSDGPADRAGRPEP